ncbi:MAG TPA: hypothetical protein VNH15_06105 [Elusimicrobiota bacterium]|nr:hypothetical protein [Elusimicrobiota bacterium]
MKKIIAGALALSVVLLSPGLECYAQAGEMADPEVSAGRVGALAVPVAAFGELSPGTDLSGLVSPANLAALPDELPSVKPEAAVSEGAFTAASAGAEKISTEQREDRGASQELSAETNVPAVSVGAASASAQKVSGQTPMGPGSAALSAARPSGRSFSAPVKASPLFSRIHERVLSETRPWHKAVVASAVQEAPAARLGGRRGPGLLSPDSRIPEGIEARTATPAAPATAAAQSSSGRNGIFQRARAWLGRFYRIFPDHIRNRDFWRFNLAQVIITQGATFYSTALPAFVAPTKALSGRMGVVRAASFGSQLGADVIMGPSVDQKKTSSFLFKTYLGRGIFLLAVPVLCFAFFRGGGLFPTLPLIGLLVGMSFLQSAGVLAANVGFNRVLGDNPAYYNKANAANSLIVNLAGVLGPALAGAFIAWANTRFGASSGSALAFGVYGLTAIVAALIYRSMTLVNRTASPAEASAPGPRLRDTLLSSKAWAGVLKQKKEILGEIKRGFKLLWHDRFLRLTLVFSTVSLLISDAIFFLAIPGYLGKIGTVVLPAFIAHAPLIGHWLAGFLGTSAAIFGLFFTASNLGATIFDGIFISRQNKGAAQAAGAADPSAAGKTAGVMAFFARIKNAVDKWLGKKLGADLTPLQKQGVWSSILTGVGWLACLSLFLTSHLWLALGAFTLSSFLQSPAAMVWSSLQQGVLNKTYPKDQAKIWSAMSVYSQVFTMAGDLIFGLVMAKATIGLSLGLVMGVMGVCAILAVIQPFVVFRPAPVPGGPKA